MVTAITSPELEDALDVHLRDFGFRDAVLRFEKFLEDRIVECLRTQKPNVEHDRL